MFRSSRNGFSLRESRLIYERESGVFEHLGAFKDDLEETYFEGNEDVVDFTLSTVGAAAYVLLKGGDAVFKAALGQKFHKPNGIGGNSKADIGSLGNNIIHIRPVRAVGDALSLRYGDIPMDFINLFAARNLHRSRYNTRAAIDKTLVA